MLFAVSRTAGSALATMVGGTIAIVIITILITICKAIWQRTVGKTLSNRSVEDWLKEEHKTFYKIIRIMLYIICGVLLTVFFLSVLF